MWRFILVTFGFLGWSFYELSDGADFVPEIAAVSTETNTQIASKTPSRPAATSAQKINSITNVSVPTTATSKAHFVSLRQNQVAPKPSAGTNVTLASVSQTRPSAQLGQDLNKARRLTHPETTAQPKPGLLDIRNVKKNRVNMRSGPGTQYGVAAKLSKGTEVEILSNLGNGWLELRVVETGKIGWMADWLITAQAG